MNIYKFHYSKYYKIRRVHSTTKLIFRINKRVAGRTDTVIIFRYNQVYTRDDILYILFILSYYT